MSATTNWIAGLAALLPHVSNVFLRNALSTILVAALGAGGFAGAFYGLGSRPVQVDEVSLDQETVRVIASEAVLQATKELATVKDIAKANAGAVARNETRLERTEALQLENTRLLNQLLGRIDVLLRGERP